jgi:hypothetical protein
MLLMSFGIFSNATIIPHISPNLDEMFPKPKFDQRHQNLDILEVDVPSWDVSLKRDLGNALQEC